MDGQTFKSKIFHAELMCDIGGRPDYWAGYSRGLRRTYHGEQFVTEAEHVLWSSLADRDDDTKDHEARCGYLDGIKTG